MKIQRTTLRLERCVSYVLVSLILGGVLVMYSVGLASGDQWVLKSDIPTPRYMLAAVALKGKIHTIGGATSEALRNVEEYDPATNTWTRKADMPTARSQLTTPVVNGKIYAIGGLAGFDGVDKGDCLSAVEEYDPAADTWTKRTDMPGLRYLLSSAVVNDRIYVMGGSSTVWPNTNFVPSVAEYTPPGSSVQDRD